MYYYTYKVQCTAVGYEDYYYLGKHVTSNLDDGYKGSGKKLKEYYTQYPDDYTFTILAFYKDKNELNKAEQKLIGDLWQTDEYCLNCIGGGNGSWRGIMTEETKQKISQANKGHQAWNKGIPCMQETRQKISATLKGQMPCNKGVPHTQATKQKMSEAAKKRCERERKEGKPGPNKGKKFSEEYKRKLSEANKGKPSAMKGKHHSEETKRNMSTAKKGKKRVWNDETHTKYHYE